MEALVSIIIAIISISLLVTSVAAAAKVNAAAADELTDELSFHYDEVTSKETSTRISFVSDTNLNNDESNNVNVIMFENNGYTFYTKK